MIHDSLQFATATMKLKWNRRLKHQSTLNLRHRSTVKSEATIDKELEAPIDSGSANEIDDFPEGSIKLGE